MMEKVERDTGFGSNGGGLDEMSSIVGRTERGMKTEVKIVFGLCSSW